MYIIQPSLLILPCIANLITTVDLSPIQHAGRIIDITGVKDAKIEDHPYQASLRIFDKHICGASIISQMELLTAAHCIYPGIEHNIRAGSAQHAEGVSIAVKDIAVHMKYNDIKFNYDIAILQLAEPLIFGERIQPIKLAKKRPPAGTNVSVAGWGCINKLCWDYPEGLKAINVHIIEQSICQKWTRKNMGPLTDDMICAVLEEGGKDACRGDSGGPLVDISTGEQVGIVSWGDGCGKSKSPGVYASIPDILNFDDMYEGFKFLDPPEIFDIEPRA